MIPIEFPEQTVIIAKDQPEYMPLPAYIGKSAQGEVISCWKMSWKERIQVCLTGKVWVSLWCFNNPVTPSRICAFKSDLFLMPKNLLGKFWNSN